MEWTDEGYLISLRKAGENHAIVGFFTKKYGHTCGMVYGAFGRRMRCMMTLGVLLNIKWRGKSSNALGYYQLEPFDNNCDDFYRLYRLSDFNHERGIQLFFLRALCSLLSHSPVQGIMPNIFDSIRILFSCVQYMDIFPFFYIIFELIFLKDMGFGLDLSKCAVTNQKHDLAYVSPRTGRAVSAQAAGLWKNRLLRLPQFFLSTHISHYTFDHLVDGFTLSQYFLKKHIIKNKNDKYFFYINNILSLYSKKFQGV